MKNSEAQNDKFSLNISQAAESLQSYDFDNAFNLIVKAMSIEPDAPQPHNLLGIFYEMTGDGNLARKHYRAAYSLDPTYKAACWNLEQITAALGNFEHRTYDFGDETMQSNSALMAD